MKIRAIAVDGETVVVTLRYFGLNDHDVDLDFRFPLSEVPELQRVMDRLAQLVQADLLTSRRAGRYRRPNR